MMAFKVVRVLGAMAVLGGIVGAKAMAQEAAEAAPAPATAAASVDVVSAYVFRGGTINDEVNVQPALEGTFYGVTLGTWANMNTDSSQFDEIDFYASYGLPLGDCPVGLSVGYTEYTYPAADHEHPGGLAAGETSPALEADREVNVVADYELALNDKTTLSTAAGGYFGIEGPFLDEGVYVEASSALSYAACEKSILSGGVTAGAELGDNVADTGLSHVDLDLGISYAALAASVKYIIETDDDVLAVDEEWVGKVGLSLPL